MGFLIPLHYTINRHPIIQPITHSFSILITSRNMETYNNNVSIFSSCLLLSIVISLSLVASNPLPATHTYDFVVCTSRYLNQFVQFFPQSWFNTTILLQVQEKAVTRLCKTRNIITVNGQFPGPTIEVRNGDNVVIKATNQGRNNVTLHW